MLDTADCAGKIGASRRMQASKQGYYQSNRNLIRRNRNASRDI